MDVQIETTLDEFRDKVLALLDEGGDDDNVDIVDIANRIRNIASAYFEVPESLAEIRATVERYSVDSDDEKAIKITMTAINSQPNRVKLAIIGDSTVTIRALQGDIEMAEVAP